MNRHERLKASKTAVYKHVSADGVVLYVGCSANPFARYGTHLSTSAWAHDVAKIEIEWFPDREMALAAEDRAICQLKPRFNSSLRIRPARKWPANVGHKFLCDWLEWVGLSHSEFALATGINRQLVKKMACEVSHPRNKTATKIEVFTAGYVPCNVWSRYWGPTVFHRVCAERAAKNFAFVKENRPWAKHFPTFQGPFPKGFFPNHSNSSCAQHEVEKAQTP